MTKISDLTAAATLTTAGLLPVVQDISSTLETRKVTLATLAAFTSTQAGDGSAATPGIAFASDPDTGLYRSGANAIGLATGGTAALTIDSSKIVRVLNNTAGAFRLGTGDNIWIWHDGGTNNVFRGQGTGVATLFQSNAGDVYLETRGAYDVIFKSNSANVGRFDQSVNSAFVVGANAAQSGSKFDVQTTGQAHALYVADADGVLHIPHDTETALRLGASDDLALGHNGTVSVIKSAGSPLYVGTTGLHAFYLRANNVIGAFLGSSGSGFAVGSSAIQSGARFDVQTTGQAHALYVADADGTLHSPWDGSVGSPNIAFGASDDARLFHDGSNAFLYNDTGALILGGRSGNVGDVQLRTDGTVALRIDHSVNQCVVVGPNVASSGSKFEVQTTGQARALYVADADGTLHLPWDGTATSPNIGFGASEDGRLHHDGTNTELRTITGQLLLRSNGSNVVLQAAGLATLTAVSTGQIRLLSLSSDPTGATAGDLYYNSTTNKHRGYDGTAWNDLY